MSNYDFDQITDRRNTGSLKWNVAEGELPMWVADMDFQTAPAVREAIESGPHTVCSATRMWKKTGIRPTWTGGRDAISFPSKKNG